MLSPKLDNLPYDIQIMICNNLSPKDLFNLSKVSKQFKKLIYTNSDIRPCGLADLTKLTNTNNIDSLIKIFPNIRFKYSKYNNVSFDKFLLNYYF